MGQGQSVVAAWISRRKTGILFAVLAVGLFVLHIWNINKLYSIQVLNDEMGYWGLAATFAGLDWSSALNYISYYAYGYSFVLTPLFWMFEDPVVMYRAAIVLNAVFIVLVFFVLYQILQIIFKKMSASTHVLLAFFACCYSSYITYSSIAWSELWLILIFSICALCFLKLLERPTGIGLFCYGCLLVYLFATHNRTIGIVISVVAVLLLAAYNKKISWRQYLQFLSGVFLGSVVHSCINWYLKNNLFNEEFLASGTMSGQIDKVLQLFSLEGLLAFLKTFLGQTFYLGVSTFLLTFWLVCVCVKNVYVHLIKGWNQRKSLKTLQYGITAMLLSLLSTVGISSLFMINPTRMDHLIYGRYNEVLAGLILAVGMGCVLSGALKFVKPFIGCASYLLLAGVVTQYGVQQYEIYNYVNAAGTWGYFASGKPQLLLAAVVTMVIFAFFCFLCQPQFIYRRWGVLLSLCVGVSLFVVTGENAIMMGVFPGQEYYRQITDVLSQREQKELPVFFEIVTGRAENRISLAPIQFAMGKQSLTCLPKDKIQEEKGPKYVITPEKTPFSFIEGVKERWYYPNQHILFSIGEDSGPSLTLALEPDCFFSQNALPRQAFLESDGNAGFLSFGPYWTLDRGLYEFRLDLKLLETATEAVGYVELVTGDRILYKEMLQKENFADNGQFTLNFSVPLKATASDIELRIYTDADVRLRMDSGSLTKRDHEYEQVLSPNPGQMQGGTIENGTFTTLGEETAVLYGPGGFLAAGFCRAQAELSLPNVGETLTGQIGVLDVADSGTVIAQIPIQGEDFVNGRCRVSLPFMLQNNIKAFELRVHVNAGHKVMVNNRTIKATDSFPISLETMSLENAKMVAETLLSNEKAGTMAFGPYLPLTRGAYTAEFSIEAAAMNTVVPELCVVDVACDQGQTVLARLLVSSERLVDGTCVVQLPFYLLEDAEDVELRLKKGEGYTLSLSRLELIANAEDSLSVPLENMLTQIGVLEARALLSKGKVGVLAYGPYMPLPQGEYLLNIDLGLEDEYTASKVEIATVSITAKRGEQVIETITLEAKDFVDGKCQLALPFELEDLAEDVEFQIMSHNEASLAVKSIDVVFYRHSEKEVDS